MIVLLAILIVVVATAPLFGWAYKHSWWRCRRAIRRLPEHRP